MPGDGCKALCTACGYVIVDLQQENDIIDQGSVEMQVGDGECTGICL